MTDQFLQVGVFSQNFGPEGVFLSFPGNLLGDTVKGQGFSLSSSGPDILIPGIDQEAHGGVLQHVFEFLGDQVNFPAILVGNIRHEGTMGALVEDGGQNTGIFSLDEIFYLVEHLIFPLGNRRKEIQSLYRKARFPFPVQPKDYSKNITAQ